MFLFLEYQSHNLRRWREAWLCKIFVILCRVMREPLWVKESWVWKNWPIKGLKNVTNP